MDIAIIMDSSRTVGWNNFETLKVALAKFTDYFDVSEEGTHFGLISFKQDPVLDFDFANSSFYNPLLLKQKIVDRKYDPGLTRMDKALTLANTKLFTDRGGARKDVPKFLIVVTNGKSSEGSQPFSGVLESLKVSLSCFIVLRSSFLLLAILRSSTAILTKKLKLEVFQSLL